MSAILLTSEGVRFACDTRDCGKPSVCSGPFGNVCADCGEALLVMRERVSREALPPPVSDDLVVRFLRPYGQWNKDEKASFSRRKANELVAGKWAEIDPIATQAHLDWLAKRDAEPDNRVRGWKPSGPSVPMGQYPDGTPDGTPDGSVQEFRRESVAGVPAYLSSVKWGGC
jgi:hypothetical protein